MNKYRNVINVGRGSIVYYGIDSLELIWRIPNWMSDKQVKIQSSSLLAIL